MQLADRLGYKTVWFTEHHFLPRFSYSSAPEVLLGYLAAKTKNIRLGHGIVLLPFRINHPLRVAERGAVLDIVSNGRLEFGGGRAICESEISAFGVDPDETRIEWEESLRMLPEMWTRENFSWKSDVITIPERSVVPKPVQKPHPPMWVACTQPATIEFAGDHGLGVLGFGIGPGQSNDYVRNYRERIKRAKPIGKAVNNRFALWVTALCADSDDEAIRIQAPNVKTYLDHARSLFASWIDGKPPQTHAWHMEYFETLYRQMEKVNIEEVLKVGLGAACIGSPDTCARVLQRLEDAGVDEVLLFMQAFTTPHDAIMRSIELFANQVKPRVRPNRVRA
ncbi:MAG: LLM class flavin-dependent oxidoreductase [Chloroflexi bacterium]|nr:LLM class flavin-dependent oxidoreductase [Chloroflexota bacterium]